MKLLIKGGTGSGKTYKAFEIAKKLGTYMYLAPTKMLAYESFIEYGGYNSRINTSSVKVGDKYAPNYFGCYAQIGKYNKKQKLTSNVKEVKEKQRIINVPYDTIIIDEAHWASQNDNHSFWIKKVVNEFDGNIILVTAEEINPPEGFETLELEGFHVEGTVKFWGSEWFDNIQNSRASLAICSSLEQAERVDESLHARGIKHHFVYRGMNENDLIKSFFDFKENGGVLVATNMAQQGINLPCDNLLIEPNNYDTTVSISQKIGRIGRRGYTKKGQINKIFIFEYAAKFSKQIEESIVSGMNDRSRGSKSITIEEFKNIYKSCISVDWNQHDYNHDDVPPIEHRDHDAEQLLKNMINKNTCIGNAQKCA